MLKMKGELTIKTISGRNGKFNVGDLKTEEGDFKVKDAILEEYDEGKYTGEFIVSRIYPNSYINFGRAIIELRVTLHQLVLDNIETLSEADNAPMTEPDPAEEQQTVEPVVAEEIASAASIEAVSATVEEIQLVNDEEPENEDAKLFAHLYPLGQVVKLDNTIDRTLFRNQRTRLKEELGYEFDFERQQWCLSTEIDRIISENKWDVDSKKDRIKACALLAETVHEDAA